MDGVNYKGRQVHVEVAETRSEGDAEPKEQLAKERKPRAEKKPERREEKSRKEPKSYREEKPRYEEKPYKKDKAKSSGKIERHSAQRAPKVQIAQDDAFWDNFVDDGDWRSFFRSGGGKPSKKHKEKPVPRKEKPVKGRKAARTVTKPPKRR